MSQTILNVRTKRSAKVAISTKLTYRQFNVLLTRSERRIGSAKTAGPIFLSGSKVPDNPAITQEIKKYLCR
jgi:hypothetical protein